MIFIYIEYLYLEEKPPKEWPHKGDIVFKNFYLRYSQNTPHVLKNLNIHIKSTEKVIYSIFI